MELSSILSDEHLVPSKNTPLDTAAGHRQSHPYPTRHTMAAFQASDSHERVTPPPTARKDERSDSNTPQNIAVSPYGSPAPKSVAFELLMYDATQARARLPMRVQIYPHDTTESIVTTVKNFYGLYGGPGGAKGVSFEDEQGNTLIARYENLRNNMIVYVRVIEDHSHMPTAYEQASSHSASPLVHQAYYTAPVHYMPPPQPAQALNYGEADERSDSRTSRKRSISPNSGRGRRSASANANPPPTKKPRSRSGYKSRGSSTHGSFADIYSDGMNGYSSGDNAPGSVSSKAKSEHLGNTEISLDNIVEGGRRKRAKFESSELPLFAPPQMPAAGSNSSVSPARRAEHQRGAFPFTHPSQHPFSHPQMLQSPQSYTNAFGQPGVYPTPGIDSRRTRTDPTYSTSKQSIGGIHGSILPTPDPTVGSCMSEEDKDVALQLMRLGEMSNISHGRTSASTVDDTFSGRADVASSTGATSEGESESEDELPPARRRKREPSPILPPGAVRRFPRHIEENLHSQASTDPSGDEAESDDGRDGTFKPDGQEEFLNDLERVVQPKGSKGRTGSQSMGKPRSKSSKAGKTAKSQRPIAIPKSKIKIVPVAGGSRPPVSPTSLPPQSRKPSVSSALSFQHQLAEDEQDLSSKPRCQRCRKSKKGCDRQRPCQRCKDAGLSADQCISEDEGNGRKGRYGRHMGVPVKKDDGDVSINSIPAAILPGYNASLEKSKKRKR